MFFETQKEICDICRLIPPPQQLEFIMPIMAVDLCQVQISFNCLGSNFLKLLEILWKLSKPKAKQN